MEEYIRLKQIREENRMSLDDVAKILNVDEREVCDWENGKKRMPTRIYIKLAMHYNLSLDYIAGLTDEKRTIK